MQSKSEVGTNSAGQACASDPYRFVTFGKGPGNVQVIAFYQTMEKPSPQICQCRHPREVHNLGVCAVVACHCIAYEPRPEDPVEDPDDES